MPRIAAVFMLGLLTASSRAEPPAPNIMILIADDLGWRDVGYHGSEIRTPHLDRLARAGVRLDRHYVYPTCSPTRAGILTGRNPARFDIHGPIADRSKQALPTDAPTLAKVLKGRGYATALMGKWHLGLRPEVGPRRYGFERSYGYLHGQLDQYTHRYKNGDRTWHRDDEFIDEKGHATDLIADEAIRFIQAKRDGPFFLWVAFSVPHHPVQEEAKWTEPYAKTIADPSRRLYAASVTHMDDAIGRIVEAMKKAGQIANTVIHFTSDNGGQRDYRSKTEYGGNHGPYPTLGDNRPLRGWKGELYEGGIRVPAFISWRDFRPAAVESTTSYLDIFPTLTDMAAVRIDPAWHLDGRNFRPFLSGREKAPPATTLWWNTGRQTGILQGDWKLILTRGKKERAELYNLVDDPAEKKDVAGEKTGQVEALRKVLAEAQKR
jgi:arylsulfatase A-like enzyme